MSEPDLSVLGHASALRRHLLGAIASGQHVLDVEDVCALLVGVARGLERAARAAGRDWDADHYRAMIVYGEEFIIEELEKMAKQAGMRAPWQKVDG